MISKTPLDNVAKLNKICADAQIGWWEVNFNTGQCLIAETLLKALEVSSELLSIDELMSTVRRAIANALRTNSCPFPKKEYSNRPFPYLPATVTSSGCTAH